MIIGNFLPGIYIFCILSGREESSPATPLGRDNVISFYIVPLPACPALSRDRGRQAGTPPIPLGRDGARSGHDLGLGREKFRGVIWIKEKVLMTATALTLYYATSAML
jgi:hypothetical protein